MDVGTKGESREGGGEVGTRLQRKRERVGVMVQGESDLSKLKPLVLKMPPSMSRTVTSTNIWKPKCRSVSLLRCCWEELHPISHHLFFFSMCLPTLCPLIFPKVVMRLVSLPPLKIDAVSLWAELWKYRRLCCLRVNVNVSYKGLLQQVWQGHNKEKITYESRQLQKELIACFCTFIRHETRAFQQFLIYFWAVCVILSRAHVYRGAGRRAGSDPAATHLPNLPLQMLQDRADAFL